MKHQITLFLLLLSVFAFAKEKISISGKIANLEADELFVSGLNFTLAIPVDADGRFSKEFEIEHPGIYTFSAAKNILPIYLAKDVRLVIDADGTDFIKTITIAGNNLEENSYLKEKARLYAPTLNVQKFYALKEPAFVRAIDSLLSENQVLLKRSGGLTPEFQRMEEKNILYGLQSHYSSYKYLHSYYTKSSIPKGKLVEAKVIPAKDIEISDEEFLFSNVFRTIQHSKFNLSFKPKFDKKPELCKTYIEESFADMKNPLVKEFLLRNLSFEVRTNAEKDRYLFDALMELSRDEKLKSDLAEKMKNIGSFVKGSAAPSFELLDQNDQKVKLEDFKGKYVFIDFWATWCKPCIAEIPSLKKVEEKFKDKNIVFLSISIDEQKDVAKWKKFLTDKDLHGTQLIVEAGGRSEVTKEYMIQSIPRFVLIDTEGFLVDINAPRPSDSKLAKMLNKLDKI